MQYGFFPCIFMLFSLGLSLLVLLIFSFASFLLENGLSKSQFYTYSLDSLIQFLSQLKKITFLL